MQKRMQYALNYFQYKVFVYWKLKLLNFLVDSVLNTNFKLNKRTVNEKNVGEGAFNFKG